MGALTATTVDTVIEVEYIRLGIYLFPVPVTSTIHPLVVDGCWSFIIYFGMQYKYGKLIALFHLSWSFVSFYIRSGEVRFKN